MKCCLADDCPEQNPQPLERFHRQKNSPDGRRAVCKTCLCARKKKNYQNKYRESERVWRKANPETIREQNLRNKYGISVDEYNVLLSQQNGKCAICHTSVSGHANGNFCVDHCHKTGKVRGLLCITCNVALGMLKDRPDLIQSLVGYLMKHG